MPSKHNVSVTTASTTHHKLLEYEAFLTGRSLSGLCSSYLEEIVNQKINKGEIHPRTLKLVDQLVAVKETCLLARHKKKLKELSEEVSSP
mgnify:CR=1 FL=1